MKRWLVLELYGSLAAFGEPIVDGIGIASPRPSLSMFTGLLANALGWKRQMGSEHDRLQARIRYGAARSPGVAERILNARHSRRWRRH